MNIQLFQGPTLTCAVALILFRERPHLHRVTAFLGKVRVNGKGCTKFKVGDRVACLSKYDGQAQLINLPERFLVRVPDGVDLKAAVFMV